MKIIPYHINDPKFADALVDAFLEITISRTAVPRESPALDQKYCLNIDEDNSQREGSEEKTVWRAPVDFPEAKPGPDLPSLLFCVLSF